MSAELEPLVRWKLSQRKAMQADEQVIGTLPGNE
jgi:hypothetical protein